MLVPPPLARLLPRAALGWCGCRVLFPSGLRAGVWGLEKVLRNRRVKQRSFRDEEMKTRGLCHLPAVTKQEAAPSWDLRPLYCRDQVSLVV